MANINYKLSTSQVLFKKFKISRIVIQVLLLNLTDDPTINVQGELNVRLSVCTVFSFAMHCITETDNKLSFN